MFKTEVYIKNMVCPRCVMTVKSILDKMNIPWSEVVLGKATVNIPPEEIDFQTLGKELKEVGFELVKDPDKVLTEKIKTLIIERIHHSDGEQFNTNFSDFLSDETGEPYAQLSKIFKENTGTTISNYIINQRIEKVKELISYGEMSFSEISYLLGFSSVAHLSRQFKKRTGMTLSQYEKENNQRKGIL